MTELLTVVIGGLFTVIVSALTIAAGRRWGKEVTGAQSDLIVTLRAEVDELRTQRDQDAAKIKELEDCRKENEELKRDVREMERELLALYRQTDNEVPSRLRNSVERRRKR